MHGTRQLWCGCALERNKSKRTQKRIIRNLLLLGALKRPIPNENCRMTRLYTYANRQSTVGFYRQRITSAKMALLPPALFKRVKVRAIPPTSQAAHILVQFRLPPTRPRSASVWAVHVQYVLVLAERAV